MMLLCSIFLNAEIPVEKANFSLTQSIDLNFNYNLKAEAKNPFFELYTEAKMREYRPKFALMPQGFSLKFSPLLYREKKQLYPALSFFYGGITKSSFLNLMLLKESFEKKPFYKGIGFAPKYLIGISKSKFDASLGTEFAIKNFNLVFFSEQKPKELWPDLSFCTVYKKENETALFNMSFFSSLTNSAYSQFNLKAPAYDQFYSGEFILAEKGTVSSVFLLAGGIKIPYGKISGIGESDLNFLGKAEYNFQSEYFEANAGTMFENDGTLKAFFQPKISVDALDLGFSYNFLRKYFEKKKLFKNFHSGGMGLGLSFTKCKFSGEIYYNDSSWDLKGQIKIPINLFFNTLFSIKGNTKLEEKSQNPFIVKNYSFSSDIKIKFNKSFNLNISASFMQKNKTVKINKSPYIVWEKGVFNFSTQAEFIKKTRLTSNSFKGEIILETAKPFIKGSLAYKISF
ncbi:MULTISPECIES: hypothetical protein [Treponema]|uniref:Uncharacterized protein n=1 Tax=Treponema denticola (strain ATCC 35405 / DSM 14222 / CIP 103919 / JCM 8153 / KCTC 15104) TaxID=243275 RepID=Q73MZ7_TREDE|nr:MULTISPECIES: hypothetical protein [Treponema]AAS11876.1 hypothetical protein TDE_1359 [Treponema denticola ATCC 35405]EMB37113.1 hypothetical protein HMPREF9735_01675 [Treponema denticola ATCC 33521]EMB41414.1 hypothetical protein HMPREF9721_00158 [Treponema denticola ATCC 35404]HCY96127.1 hypothetical protein [Treponema sp.]